MDSIISFRQKNTLDEYMILSDADNRPPMLDKDLYDSCKIRMELYMQNKEHGRMILESVEHGLLIWPTVEENGLPADIYSLMNHHRVAKDLWERFQLLMQGYDLIAYLNKAMAFLTAVASLRLPSTNNQLRTSSNTRNQATIQDGRPKRQKNTTWYKEKAMLAEAWEAGQILDEEQLAFLADPGIPAGQAQIIIPHNVAFQTEDLDTYYSDCDDLLNAQAVLMANISNYGSDVTSEEKANNEQNNKSITAELEIYKERVKTFERLNIDLSSHEKMIDSQMDDFIKEKLALKEKVDLLEQNLLKQITEK
nr:hypothetical protein [Tanacetum cinerariifolium]